MTATLNPRLSLERPTELARATQGLLVMPGPVHGFVGINSLGGVGPLHRWDQK